MFCNLKLIIWNWHRLWFLNCYSQDIERHNAVGGYYLIADVVENMIEKPILIHSVYH